MAPHRPNQEPSGSWGGIQPPWVWGIIALAALGYGLDDPTLGKAVEGWQGFMVEEGDRLRPEACQSPVWDTVLTMTALADAGLPPDDPSLTRAARWVLDEEIRGPGDWQVRRPDVAAGGWAFEFDNDNYPDTDDTAEVVLALRRVAPKNQAAIDRALTWLAGMQSKDGGWGEDLRSYDDQALGGRGESTASQTAWALLALLAAGERENPATERGIRWLAETQRDDGTWDEPWFTGTGFPGDFYINYHLYRLAFPVSALGRYVHGGDT